MRWPTGVPGFQWNVEPCRRGTTEETVELVCSRREAASLPLVRRPVAPSKGHLKRVTHFQSLKEIVFGNGCFLHKQAANMTSHKSIFLRVNMLMKVSDSLLVRRHSGSSLKYCFKRSATSYACKASKSTDSAMKRKNINSSQFFVGSLHLVMLKMASNLRLQFLCSPGSASSWLRSFWMRERTPDLRKIPTASRAERRRQRMA